MKNNSKILIALGAGLALGGLLGVLFAPDKGAETRQKISDNGKKLAAAAKDKIIKTKDKLSDLKEEILEKMDAVNNKVKDIV